jgi:hypothetical protein
VPEPVVEDLHEYLSFEDPDEDRTWIFDATFFLSSWTCIWGRGCQGVLTADATELNEGCCSYGAHFIDENDRKAMAPYVKRLTDANWQFRKRGMNKGWHTTDDEGTITTRVVEGACIFLNRPGFAGGAGCALHQGAMAAGERPMDWKPDVCWQVPMRLEEQTDGYGHVTSTLREWKRRDWGEGGFEFHWWCTDSHEAFVGRQPAYAELRDEITEIVGPKVYAILLEQLQRREGKRVAPLPHPAASVPMPTPKRKK